MTMDSHIAGPLSGRRAAVSKSHALHVTSTPPDLPAAGEQNRYTFYNALLGSAGAVETGITNANMNQDGSITSAEFFVGAEPETDIRIMRIAIVFADTAVVHSNFGNISALTNGFDLRVFERGVETNLLRGAKTGGQVIAQAGLFSPYGNTATSFELTNWTGTEDAQTVVIDVASLVPGGIRIGKTTEDKIFATVNDDLTGLSEFTVRVMGYRHHA